MGCNCKATDYVRATKKYYGYEPETKENIPTKEKVKMAFQAVFMWIIIILFFPIVLFYLVFVKAFLKKETISLFKTIKVRI